MLFLRGGAAAAPRLRKCFFQFFMLTVFCVDVSVSALVPLLTAPTTTRRRTLSPITVVPSSSSSNNGDTTNTAATAAATDLEYLATVREGIAAAGLQDDWTTAATFLSDDLALDLVDAEDALARAWNWRSWAVVQSPMARKFIRPIPPNMTQIQNALTWWRRTGPLAGRIPDPVLRRGVREHPNVYLIAPDQMYEQALSVAPEAYRNADTFHSLLVEMPSVLGCTYNCVDTGCNSNCGNCWVSFQTVLKQSSKKQ